MLCLRRDAQQVLARRRAAFEEMRLRKLEVRVCPRFRPGIALYSETSTHGTQNAVSPAQGYTHGITHARVSRVRTHTCAKRAWTRHGLVRAHGFDGNRACLTTITSECMTREPPNAQTGRSSVSIAVHP